MTYILAGLIGFFLGALVILTYESGLIRRQRSRGYQHAVHDILENHLYMDKNGEWHQLEVIWRDLSRK